MYENPQHTFYRNKRISNHEDYTGNVIIGGKWMHYCTLLITKEFPSESEIAEIMTPYYRGGDKYDDETEDGTGDYPIFTFEWYRIGGRYNGALKLKVDEKDDYYEWGYLTEDRNKRLFYSYLLTEMKNFAGDDYRYLEENYYP